jgi:hypothetical protein
MAADTLEGAGLTLDRHRTYGVSRLTIIPSRDRFGRIEARLVSLFFETQYATSVFFFYIAAGWVQAVALASLSWTSHGQP